MNDKLVKTLVALVSLAVCIPAGLYFCYWAATEEYTVERERMVTYRLPHKYDDVRKVLIRCNVLEEMVNAQHGRVLNKDMDNISIESNAYRPLAMDIKASSSFVVQPNEAEHSESLDFCQIARLGADRAEVETYLQQPSGPIRILSHTLVMRRAYTGSKDNTTEFTFRVKMTYRRRIPLNYKKTMDDEVTKAVERMLVTHETNMTRIMARHADRKFVIPLQP